MRLQVCKHARDLFLRPIVLTQTMAPWPTEYLRLLPQLPGASQNRNRHFSLPLVPSMSRLHVVQVQPPPSTSFLHYTPYLPADCGNMQRRSLAEQSPSCSFKPGTPFEESDYTRPTDDGVDPDTNLTDVATFANKDDEDEASLSPDNDHPPEYYLRQLENFNEEEYVKEDYKKSSTRLLNRIEEQWSQYVSCSLRSLRQNA
jgi:hypothetical protein